MNEKEYNEMIECLRQFVLRVAADEVASAAHLNAMACIASILVNLK